MRDRGVAGIAAAEDANGLRELLRADALFEARHFVGTCGDVDRGYQRARGDTPKRVQNDGNAVEVEKLLGRLGAHAGAEAGGGKDGGNAAHALCGTAEVYLMGRHRGYGRGEARGVDSRELIVDGQQR